MHTENEYSNTFSGMGTLFLKESALGTFTNHVFSFRLVYRRHRLHLSMVWGVRSSVMERMGEENKPVRGEPY